MTMIPPGKSHKVTIVVTGPKNEKAVQKYMAAIRKAVGRSATIVQTPKPKPKPKPRPKPKPKGNEAGT